MSEREIVSTTKTKHSYRKICTDHMPATVMYRDEHCPLCVANEETMDQYKRADKAESDLQRAFMAGYSEGITASESKIWGPVDGHRRFKKWENER